jgi:8-oxo-dGTP pyrophosphatase MutT (NUDIX family)
MWKVITTAKGFLGIYTMKPEADAVAKEYNRKGNRPGTAKVLPLYSSPSSGSTSTSTSSSSSSGSSSYKKKKSPWKKSSSMYGKSTSSKSSSSKSSSGKKKKSSWSSASTFGADDYPYFSSSSSSSSYMPSYTPPPKSLSTGGVVISDDGRVLVREVANKFSGVAWSIAKGGVDAGETEEQAALREVLEETGWVAEIVEKIPGEWEGSTTINRYFLMRPVQNTGSWQYMDTSKEETWSVAWVPREACAALFHLGSKKSATRDTEVVNTAWNLWLNTEAGMAWKDKRTPKPKKPKMPPMPDFPDFEDE